MLQSKIKINKYKKHIDSTAKRVKNSANKQMIKMEKGLIEIRIHGRGGQGGKSAAFIYAQSCMKKGWHIKAFPEYGAEREGAPVRAFIRLSKHPIKVHSNVYHPDYVLILDKTLINETAFEGITKETTVILNISKSDAKSKNPKISKLKKNAKALYFVDATKISIETVGKNFPNIPILGALEKISGLSSLESVKESVADIKKDSWSHKVLEQNFKAIREGYNSVKEI